MQADAFVLQALTHATFGGIVPYVLKKNAEKLTATVRIPHEVRRELDDLGTERWPRSYRKPGAGKVSTQIVAGALLFIHCTDDLRKAVIEAVEMVETAPGEITAHLHDAGLPVPQKGTTGEAKADSAGGAGRERRRA